MALFVKAKPAFPAACWGSWSPVSLHPVGKCQRLSVCQPGSAAVDVSTMLLLAFGLHISVCWFSQTRPTLLSTF